MSAKVDKIYSGQGVSYYGSPVCCERYMLLVPGYWAWSCLNCSTLVSMQPATERK